MLEAWRTFRRLRPEPRWRRRLAPPREVPPAGGTLWDELHAWTAEPGREIRAEGYATAGSGTEQRPCLVWIVVDENGERHELGEIVAGASIRVETADGHHGYAAGGLITDGIRDQDGVEPIGERNQCWRCWAKAVDEGDELGLCDRCKADLKDPETGPDEATNVHAIAERYSARDLLEIALERRAAGEMIPEAVIDGLRYRAEVESRIAALMTRWEAEVGEDGYDNRAGG